MSPLVVVNVRCNSAQLAVLLGVWRRMRLRLRLSVHYRVGPQGDGGRIRNVWTPRHRFESDPYTDAASGFGGN